MIEPVRWGKHVFDTLKKLLNVHDYFDRSCVCLRFYFRPTFATSIFLLQGQAVAQLAKTVKDVTVFGVCSKSKHEALKANNNNIDHLLERGSDYTSEVRK